MSYTDIKDTELDAPKSNKIRLAQAQQKQKLKKEETKA